MQVLVITLRRCAGNTIETYNTPKRKYDDTRGVATMCEDPPQA